MTPKLTPEPEEERPEETEEDDGGICGTGDPNEMEHNRFEYGRYA